MLRDYPRMFTPAGDQDKDGFKLENVGPTFSRFAEECSIATLYQRRKVLTERLFEEIKDNRQYGLLPAFNSSDIALRRKRVFNIPISRTNRFQKSFIMHNAVIF